MPLRGIKPHARIAARYGWWATQSASPAHQCLHLFQPGASHDVPGERLSHYLCAPFSCLDSLWSAQPSKALGQSRGGEFGQNCPSLGGEEASKRVGRNEGGDAERDCLDYGE